MKNCRKISSILICTIVAGSINAQNVQWMDVAIVDEKSMIIEDQGNEMDLQQLHKEMSSPEELIEFWNRVTRHYVFSDAQSTNITESDLVNSVSSTKDGGLPQLFTNNGFIDNDPMMTSTFWQIKGLCQGSSNQISWTTKGESNVSHHVVERSSDGYSAFVEIGSTEAANEGDSKVMYEFIDENPQEFGYYRIKTVGLNEDQLYSDIVYLEKPTDQLVQNLNAHFDVASAEVFVEYLSSQAQPIEIAVYNKAGQKVKSNVFMDHPLNQKGSQINMNDLTEGEYQITMRQGSNAIIKKMVKQNQNDIRLY